MTYTVGYRRELAADTSRTPSEAIWADCPVLEIENGAQFGTHHFDDFTGFEDVAAGAAGVHYGKYYVDADTGVTLALVNDTDFGAIQVANNDAAQDGGVLVYGKDSGFARFAPGDDVWFEARLSVGSIADGALAQFIGLAEMNADPSASNTLVDTTGIPDASEDFVGFSVLATDGDIVECIYQEGGATRVNVGDLNSAIAASTYYKVGLRFRGQYGQRGKLYYYLNGQIVQELEVTGSLSFPDVNHMGLVWATKAVNTAAATANIDWIRVAATGGNI